MEAELLGISGLGGAGVVWTVVQMLRNSVGTNIVKDGLTTPLAIVIGIGLNVVLKLDHWIEFEETTWTGTVILGFMVGLSASGAHNFVKKVANGG